jgi:ABC-type transporter Mla MlaB component
MQEQRRHVRIRFAKPLPAYVGHKGQNLRAELHNVSLGGALLRTDLPLAIGDRFGLEFALQGMGIDTVPIVISRGLGDLVGVRFDLGPASEIQLEGAIQDSLRNGIASVLSMHTLAGRKVMRIAGALNLSLRNDFFHALDKMGVAEIDLSEVTTVDADGLALCVVAAERRGVVIERLSPAVANLWRAARQPSA